MEYRKDVNVNLTLLEEATKVAGEDSASAVVDKALSEFVRIAQLKRGIQATKDTSVKQERFRRALEEWDREAAKGGMFHPDYLAEKSAYSMLDEPKQGLPADVKRTPRQKKKRNVRRAAR
jgi:hypothetical protein